MLLPRFLSSILLAATAFASPVVKDSANAHEVRDPAEAAAGSYWFENIQKQGLAAFNPNPTGFKVFRNVKDYGARGEFDNPATVPTGD